MKGYIERVVGSEKAYQDMIQAFKTSASMPICLGHQDAINANITLQDMKDFANRVYEDAGFVVKYEIEVCEDCGKLNFHMIIDEPEEYYEQ